MSKFIDSFRHKGLRKKLVQEVREKGITDDSVLEAMEKLPRHYFLDSSFVEFAYQDKAFPIGSGQTISQPYTVAFQTQLMQVKKGDKILEIGTGSGYQATILHLMGAKVFTIERQKELFVKTKAFLETLNYRVKVFFGDGYKGLPAFAPFDKIIVTCGAPFIPEMLVEQLKPGGIMIIPVGDDVQTMISVEKNMDGSIVKKEHGAFRFVPMLEKKNDGKNNKLKY
ncbi:MAG: protein-L-isoaspartate(D-aspartate) O-methyltransferase [Bacteroidales bacterium]|nr:protein-L-isoaspartate(D-aspartate) O-methyltransferase [Bacteroidales bacterium]MDY0217213.1 protein-L-isoaspartate(D-aspartate) O-methyltransferase [Bacteroidales bacterium]